MACFSVASSVSFRDYSSDMMLENKVLEQGAEYMEGRRELDEAVEAIAESVEIYLYE